MNEHPILFSKPMVRAILEGRKTQTRRVVKPQPAGRLWNPPTNPPCLIDNEDRRYPCPHGQPGDRLWVREKWRIVGWDAENGDWTVEYADGVTKRFDSVECLDDQTAVRYWIQCTDDCDAVGIPIGDDDLYHFDEVHPCPTRWRPSIFMPRCFSRITLELVSVRVERVQEITRDGAKAEGVSNCWEWPGDKDPKQFVRGVLTPYIANFSVLWDEINADRGFGWDVNPWVWVVEFRKVTP